MLEIIGLLCFLPFLPAVCPQEQAEHRNFQYNSPIDPLTGRYNFAYDTGNDNDIAHSLHMQYQDADGMVRGRYGYTDPHGKLRMVEYEAGPNGFVARGDVGPDQSLHDNAPAVNADSPPSSNSNVRRPLSSYSEGDFLLDPAPVQMAGWNPEGDPMNQVQPLDESSVVYDQGGGLDSSDPQFTESEISTMSPFDRSLFPTLNVTGNVPLTVYDSESNGEVDGYPRISYFSGEGNAGTETESENYRTAGENQSEDTQGNSDLNVNNIDVDPQDIRTAAAGSNPVRRSAGGSSSRSGAIQEEQVRSQPVKVTTSDGRRLFYRDSHSMEPHEHYYYGSGHSHAGETRYYRPRYTYYDDSGRRYYRPRQTHDHDAERRYYSSRQTHDHDAERRYYSSRQTHDHDAERRYYRARQTHDHDAETKSRQTHDHDAERSNYYQRVYRNGKVLYVDRHSTEPHAHYSQPYRNHNDHQHSDVHLYGRYRNSDYPVTAKPRQLQYIPSDKYHDKSYYWTSS